MSIAITPDNFELEVLKSSKPVVVDVYATWCGPCMQMAPIFEELEKELNDSYKFATINVDEAREISINLGVTSVPTFLFVKDGAVVGKETGAVGKDDLKAKIAELLG